MIERDYLIIGAGVGAAAACQSLRQYDSKGSVTVIGNESFPPYHRSQLLESILLSDGEPQKKNHPLPPLACYPPEWYSEHKIDLRLNTLVTQFNIDRRLAVLNSGEVIHFRKALLAMGSRPTRPRVAGAHLGHILTARTLRDILALKEIVAGGVKNIIILGGGFVATETAGALKRLGAKVSIMSHHPHLWQRRLDADTAAWLTDYFQTHDLPVFQESLNGFEGKTVLQNIQTKSGRSIPASVAILALGTELNLGLVANTPLANTTGSPVNDLLETDEKGIYALGDIALHPDPFFGSSRRTPFYENTLLQGQIAGSNITGKKRQRYKAIPQHRTKALDLEFHFIGDFRLPPTSFEIEGDRSRGQFTARYFQGQKLRGILLCNQPESAIEAAKAAFTT